MKKIILIVFLAVCALSVNAQVLRPSGLPITNSTGYAKWGYPSADSGYVWNNARDTFPAKYPTTIWHSNGNFYKTPGGVGSFWSLWIPATPGTLTTISVVSANGITGTVANATTTPAITLGLNNITPTSVNSSGAITGTTLAGTIVTASQPNITLVGTLSALTVTNSITAANYYGSGKAITGVLTDVRAGTGISIATNGGVFTVTNSSTANVSSVSGTSNQVIASPTTGAVIVGLPTNVIVNGTLSASGVISSGAITATKYIAANNILFATAEEYGYVSGDATLYLQAAINSRRPVMLGQKIYTISSTLTALDGTYIFGSGDSSILQTSASIDVITCLNLTNFGFSNFRIIGAGGSSKGIMINGSTFSASSLDRMYYQGLYQGFYFTGNYLTHAALRVSNNIARNCTFGFYNDAYGEYTNYVNCISEYNGTGWYNIAGNNTWNGGSITNNTYANVWLKYGANNGHGGIYGADINHGDNYAILCDSITVGFNFANNNIFFGKIYIKNSINVKFENNLMSRQDSLLVGGSTLTEFNNNTFIVSPIVLNTAYLLYSNVKWFNNVFSDKTYLPPVSNSLYGNLKTIGAVTIANNTTDTTLNGLNFTTHNLGFDTTLILGRIRMENLDAFGAQMAFYTHPDNSSNDTSATKKFVIGKNGDIYAPKLYDQSGSGSDSILVKNSTLGQLKLIPQSSFGTGSVTTVSIVSANGITGTVANASTTPAITLGLNVINPTGVNSSGAITGTTLAGTIVTASQPNVTLLGTLSALTVTNSSRAGTFYGAGTGITGLANTNLSGSAGITNANLANSSLTVTAGTGMGGGGVVSLGGSVTLSNTGVTSIIAGSNITISGSTGAVTINASGGTGVTSIASTVGISVSASGSATTLTNTGLLGAYNGLTNTSGQVALGGTLSQPTTITTGSNRFYSTRTQTIGNVGAQSFNGELNLTGVTTEDNTQNNYSGIYGSLSMAGSTAYVLNYKSIYSANNGTSYLGNTNSITGTTPVSGVSGWNVFYASGAIAATAALHAKTPMKQVGQTVTSIIAKHAGLWLDSIRTATDMSITNAYGINQASSLDTNILAGVNVMGVINGTSQTLSGNLSITGSIISATISSGEYSVTSSFQSNVTSYVLTNFKFVKQGNNVIVSGYVDIVPTAASTITYLRFSVPFPYTYTSTTTFNGSIVFTDGGTVFYPGQINGNNAGSSVGAGLIAFSPVVANGITSYGGRFTAMYTIQ